MPCASTRGLLVTMAMVCLLGCAQERPAGLVAGTAHIEQAVAVVTGGDETAIAHTIIPASMCPGHYDAKPSDIEAIRGCTIAVLHEWQRPMEGIQRLIQSAGLTPDRVLYVATPGNWMVPETQAAAVEALAQALAKAQPEREGDYVRNAAAQRRRVEQVAADLQGRLARADAGQINVLANEMIAPLVKWMGLNVVGTFGRAEDSSVADVEALVARARQERIALVVDNLQSGDAQTGAMLARETQATHVMLTNFPGGFEGARTWQASIEENVERIAEALAAWRGAHG